MAGMFFSSDKKSLRALSLLGMKPANINRSEGKPESCKAQTKAQGPGMVVI